MDCEPGPRQVPEQQSMHKSTLAPKRARGMACVFPVCRVPPPLPIAIVGWACVPTHPPTHPPPSGAPSPMRCMLSACERMQQLQHSWHSPIVGALSGCRFPIRSVAVFMSLFRITDCGDLVNRKPHSLCCCHGGLNLQWEGNMCIVNGSPCSLVV